MAFPIRLTALLLALASARGAPEGTCTAEDGSCARDHVLFQKLGPMLKRFAKPTALTETSRQHHGGSDDDEGGVEEEANTLEPGMYKVEHDGTFVDPDIELGDVFRTLRKGSVVEIVDIQPLQKAGRIRGKLANGGWISIKNTNTGYMWARPEARYTEDEYGKQIKVPATVTDDHQWGYGEDESDNDADDAANLREFMEKEKNIMDDERKAMLKVKAEIDRRDAPVTAHRVEEDTAAAGDDYATQETDETDDAKKLRQWMEREKEIMDDERRSMSKVKAQHIGEEMAQPLQTEAEDSPDEADQIGAPTRPKDTEGLSEDYDAAAESEDSEGLPEDYDAAAASEDTEGLSEEEIGDEALMRLLRIQKVLRKLIARDADTRDQARKPYRSVREFMDNDELEEPPQEGLVSDGGEEYSEEDSNEGGNEESNDSNAEEDAGNDSNNSEEEEANSGSNEEKSNEEAEGTDDSNNNNEGGDNEEQDSGNNDSEEDPGSNNNEDESGVQAESEEDPDSNYDDEDSGLQDSNDEDDSGSNEDVNLPDEESGEPYLRVEEGGNDDSNGELPWEEPPADESGPDDNDDLVTP